MQATYTWLTCETSLWFSLSQVSLIAALRSNRRASCSNFSWRISSVLRASSLSCSAFSNLSHPYIHKPLSVKPKSVSLGSTANSNMFIIKYSNSVNYSTRIRNHEWNINTVKVSMLTATVSGYKSTLLMSTWDNTGFSQSLSKIFLKTKLYMIKDFMPLKLANTNITNTTISQWIHVKVLIKYV